VAFQKVKQSLNNTPLLALQYFPKTYVVEADASREGIEVDLMQEHDLNAYINLCRHTRKSY